MVNSKNMPVSVLWDLGADISFITNRMAKKLGLSGKHINLSMIKVGNAVEYHSSNEYCVPLIDKSGKVWNVNAVGFNEITAKIKKVDLSRVSELFEGISNLELNRPHGEIDMLIGASYCEILPRVVETNKGLQLLENQFGFSIRGRPDEITNQVNTSNHVFVRIHKLSSSVNLNEINIDPTENIKDQLDKFFAIEEMGTRSNARLRTTENRLRKLGNEYAMKYQKEIKDMVRRGVARKLTNKEIQEYNGPIHYIHHHEVLKPDSSSTPVRIVFNSSASYMG
ncbi:uncharacterized protein [Palaemon carinicauda]|uniref:uncharacterized protein n=1 Tax=Palaemon carinicauda TaxID=392227 RepID=UPI0035B63A28